jgi:hypothetical protein
MTEIIITEIKENTIYNQPKNNTSGNYIHITNNNISMKNFLWHGHSNTEYFIMGVFNKTNEHRVSYIILSTIYNDIPELKYSSYFASKEKKKISLSYLDNNYNRNKTLK